MLLEPLTWVGTLVGGVALTFSIASGLYVISEYVEERSILAKKIITHYVQAVIVIHVLLWLLDGLSFWRSVFSIITNCIYLELMKQFPVVHLSGLPFILAAIASALNHIFWFRYFSNDDLPPYSIYESVPTYRGETLPPFRQISSFFGLLIWTFPFLLLISLSANDNVLPTVNPNAESDIHRKKRVGLFRSWTDKAIAYLQLGGLSPGSTRRQDPILG